jgi:hypothetical protein
VAKYAIIVHAVRELIESLHVDGFGRVRAIERAVFDRLLRDLKTGARDGRLPNGRHPGENVGCLLYRTGLFWTFHSAGDNRAAISLGWMKGFQEAPERGTITRRARLGIGRQSGRDERTGENHPGAPAKKQDYTEGETAVQNCVTRNPFSSIV